MFNQVLESINLIWIFMCINLYVDKNIFARTFGILACDDCKLLVETNYQ